MATMKAAGKLEYPELQASVSTPEGLHAAYVASYEGLPAPHSPPSTKPRVCLAGQDSTCAAIHSLPLKKAPISLAAGRACPHRPLARVRWSWAFCIGYASTTLRCLTKGVGMLGQSRCPVLTNSDGSLSIG